MQYLVVEVLLRLAKVGAATLIGVLVYALVTGPLGNAGSAELFLLAWLVGAGVVLLAESSPI
jgi:hypothetical protein